jgi:hypothetical protein
VPATGHGFGSIRDVQHYSSQGAIPLEIGADRALLRGSR